jgi:hypothetical protein
MLCQRDPSIVIRVLAVLLLEVKLKLGRSVSPCDLYQEAKFSHSATSPFLLVRQAYLVQSVYLDTHVYLSITCPQSYTVALVGDTLLATYFRRIVRPPLPARITGTGQPQAH